MTTTSSSSVPGSGDENSNSNSSRYAPASKTKQSVAAPDVSCPAHASTTASTGTAGTQTTASTSTGTSTGSNGPIPKQPMPMSSSAHGDRRSSVNSTAAATSPEEQRRQDKRVFCIRVATVTTLVAATVTVATFVGWYVSKDELSNFELQYNDSVAKLAVQFQERLDTKYEVAKTFSAMVTSRYGNVAQRVMGLEPLWPNVTVPNFQEQSAGSLAIADGRALSYNPIIKQDVNRKEWEQHAADSAWILGSERLITPLPNTTWPDNRTVSFGIYSRNSQGQVAYDPGFVEDSLYPNAMVPVWQIAPIKGNEKAVMFNLHAEPKRRRALDHMMSMKVAAITDILQLVQDSETRPSSILFYPVFDVFANNEGVDAEDRRESEVDTQGEQDTESEQDVESEGAKIVARGTEDDVRRLRSGRHNTVDTGEHMTGKQNTADTRFEDTKIVARGTDDDVRRNLRLARQKTADTGEDVIEKQNAKDTGDRMTVKQKIWDIARAEYVRDMEGRRTQISARKDGGTEDQNVEGSISIVFSWDTLLDSILPDYIKGMVCVLQTSTGQKFSYKISGDTVTLLGQGDQHDPEFDEYGQHVNAKLLYEERSKEFILFALHMYPSAEFKSQYVTNRAGIYAAGTVLIFLFTAGMFVLYDYLVEDRQKRTARLARQRGNIVDAMFPAAFRERLYRIHGDGAPRAHRGSDPDVSVADADTGIASTVRSGAGAEEETKSAVSNNSRTSGTSSNSLPKPITLAMRKSSTLGPGGKKGAMNKIDKFMRGIRTEAKNAHSNRMMASSGSGPVDEEPIADLFQDTSIMFSDIVGFTKWSSERSPHEVFRLLEQIFWEFDDLAAKHNVFKLGTIGDCYIAVTGIPDPIQDHAIVLTQFTFDARDKVREVCARLNAEGLDTAKLDMRFGIHSGATTAGILRGTKSRFELFGDTINTASRMESTGLGGKIQVSEETAELIRRDCKSRWLSKRDTLVAAKGKGELQTYWVEPERAGCRVSFSEDLIKANFLADLHNNGGSSRSLGKLGRRSSRGSSGTPGSDRFYQHEYGSSGGGSSVGQLSQWEEEKIEEEQDQLSSSTRVNDDVDLTRQVSLEDEREDLFDYDLGSKIASTEAKVLGASGDVESGRVATASDEIAKLLQLDDCNETNPTIPCDDETTSIENSGKLGDELNADDGLESATKNLSPNEIEDGSERVESIQIDASTPIDREPDEQARVVSSDK